MLAFGKFFNSLHQLATDPTSLSRWEKQQVPKYLDQRHYRGFHRLPLPHNQEYGLFVPLHKQSKNDPNLAELNLSI